MTEEEKAIEELKAMSSEELDKVDCDKLKWKCQCKGCNGYTTVRDFGIPPFYYHNKEGWKNLNISYWLCGKHVKFWKRLLKNYDQADIEAKLLDLSVMPYDKLVTNLNKKNNERTRTSIIR